MSRKRKKRELTEADIAACEPEAIWLETRRCPLPAHCVLAALILLLVSLVTWACLAKVDKVVAAEGRLTTTRPNITLKPLERTVVKSVEVHVGQVVEAGQTLITLDPTVNAAELATLQQQRDIWLCHALRLRAEQQESETFNLPPDLAASESGRTQQKIWQTRQAYHRQKMRSFAENIARYQAIAGSVRSSLDKYAELMQPMRQIEEIYSSLQRQGATARIDVCQVQMQRMGNEIEIENQRASLVENQQLEKSARAEAQVFEEEWRKDIASELAEVELKLSELEEKIRQTAWLAQQERLQAPCRSMVHEIAPYQEGSAVREAEAMITLVPLDSGLEAQVDILAQDVGLLRRGDRARIKLDAFPFQQYGTLEGTIASISADTYESHANAQEQTDSSVIATGGRTPQFRARLTLSGHLKSVPDELWQSAGMKLRAEIKVGERRVISYLLNPFIKALDESIREP